MRLTESMEHPSCPTCPLFHLKTALRRTLDPPRTAVPNIRNRPATQNLVPRKILPSKGVRGTSNRTPQIRATSRIDSHMPQKHPNTERVGGPGASHENRQHPEKSQPRNESRPIRKVRGTRVFRVEEERLIPIIRMIPLAKGGQRPHTKRDEAAHHSTVSQSECAVSHRGGMNQESDHNKHNDSGQAGHKAQKHTELEEKKTK